MLMKDGDDDVQPLLIIPIRRNNAMSSHCFSNSLLLAHKNMNKMMVSIFVAVRRIQFNVNLLIHCY